WKRSPVHRNLLLDGLGAPRVLGHRRIVVDSVGSAYLVDDRQVALVEAILDDSPRSGQVCLRHHASLGFAARSEPTPVTGWRQRAADPFPGAGHSPTATHARLRPPGGTH